jgi:CheY-like chemotaxis protein
MSLILLITPDKIARSILSTGLRRYGYDVISTERGSEGIFLALSELPDLIVMDIDAPEIDGWEAIKIFKESQVTGKIPVVALAERRVDGDLLVQQGFDAYERKPALLKRIVTRAEALLPNQPLTLPSTPLKALDRLRSRLLSA